MKLRILLLALVSILIGTEAAQAQWGRGGGRGYGRGGAGVYAGVGNPYSGFSIGVGNTPRYYGNNSPYYGNAYGYNRYYAPRYSYTPNTVYVPSTDYPPNMFVPGTTFVEPQSNITPASATVNAPSGMKITEVFDNGAAKKSGLQTGDIITAIGTFRTQSFEDVQTAFARSSGPVEVTFLDGKTMQTEKTKVTPNDGKIGVFVVPVYLP